MSNRRSARLHDHGVRLNEELGVVTTSRSRAEAYREEMRTRALAKMLRH